MITDGLTPAAPAPSKALVGPSASSTVIRQGPDDGSRYSSLPSSYPLLGLRSATTIRDRHRAQQSDRQAKAEPETSRVSRADPERWQTGGIQGYVEPPFSLDVLTDMLFESDVYYSTVRQFGVDACSGWSLVDASEGSPSDGWIDPSLGTAGDTLAAEQRLQGEKLLDSICYDYDENRISLTSFSQMLQNDRDSTGNAHHEIVRENGIGKPIQFIHIPARLIRRGVDGRTYVQLDDSDRPVAFFRRYGAEVKPIDPATFESETPWAYVSKEEAAVMKDLLPAGEQPQVGTRHGDLKRELADFKIYHPRERYYGIPPIVAAFQSIVGNILASNRNVRFFVNRGIPEWIFLIKGPAAAFMDDATRGQIVDPIQQTIEDHMKYLIQGEDFRTLTLRIPSGDWGLEWEKLGGDPKDMEWTTYQETNRDNIIHVYGMQPSKIGIVETASLGTGSGESQDETYKRSQIEPRQQLLESFWNQVLDELGFTAVRFRYHELDVVDRQGEASVLGVISATGALSVNDIRAWASRLVKDQDFPPVPHEWADMPIKILDTVVAGMLAMPQGATATTAASGVNPLGSAIGRLAAMAGIGGIGPPRQTPEDALARLRQGTGRVAAGVRPNGNGRQAPQPQPPAPGAPSGS